MANRGKTRRKAVTRRNTRSTSWRWRENRRADGQGARRGLWGGTTGVTPNARASLRGAGPAEARSLKEREVRRERREPAPEPPPGRGSRGTQRKGGRPADLGVATGLEPVFFTAPRPAGYPCTLGLTNETASRGRRTSSSRCHASQTRSQPLPLRPASQAGGEGMPLTATGWPAPPLAPVLGPIQPGVQARPVGEAPVAVLDWQTVVDPLVVDFTHLPPATRAHETLLV